MTEIILANNNLPSTIEDLAKFVLIGRDRMTAVRAEISAINRLGLAQEVRQQKLAEAQQISEVVLDAEVKLGELISAMPKAKNQYESAIPNVGKSKKDALNEIGFSTSQADRLETLAKHPEIVAQAKAEAREADDIVSRSFVLEKIKAKAQQEKTGAHGFDKLAILNKKQAIIAECKSKARRNKYADTGINIRHLEEYEYISKKHNLPVFIFFVDELVGKIYGNTLKELLVPCVVDGKKYPSREKGIIYFPLINTKPVCDISAEEAELMKANSTRNYEYAQFDMR